MIKLVIPGTPPSGNHYVKHTRTGRHYVTGEARKFKEDVSLLAQGQSMPPGRYHVDMWVYMGHGEKGDVDNFPKVALDALRDAGVIKSDAMVDDLEVHKRRDAVNPRTVISIYLTT